MLPFGLITETTAASSPVNRGGAGGGGPMGKTEDGLRQFSDDLQESLQTPAPESLGQGGQAVSDPKAGASLDALKADVADLAGDGIADTDAAVVAEALENGAVLADAPGAAVLGTLAEVWQIASGGAAVGEAGAAGPGAGEGGLADEAGLPLVRPAVAGGAAVAGAGGNAAQDGGVAANAGGAGKSGFAAALGSNGAGPAGTPVPASLSGSVPANASGDGPDLPVPVNRQPSVGAQVEGAAESVVGQQDKSAAAANKVADPVRPDSSSRAADEILGRTGGEPVVEPKQRRWQVSLPPELRSQSAVVQVAPQQTPVVRTDASGEVLELAQSSALAQAAGQAAGLKEPVVPPLKPLGQSGAQGALQSQVSASVTGQPVTAPQTGEVPVAADEAVVRQLPVAELGKTAQTTASVSPAQAAQTSNAQPPVAPVPPSGKPMGSTISQSSTAEAGAVELGLDDLPVEANGDPVRLERRPAGEMSIAGAKAPSVNSATPQLPGLTSGQPQMLGMQSSGGAVQQSAIPAAALSNEIIADEILPASAFEAELGADLDFTATVRGGEMQGAARTEALQTPNQAQSSQLASQVAVEMARNLKSAQTRFQMRFDPPELGRVDVNMKVSADGSVQAHLIVERPETLDMFLRDQRSLERALEAAGLNTNSNDLQFSLKQGPGQQFASQDDRGQQNGQSGTANAGADDNGDASIDEAMDGQLLRMTLAEQRGGLDVRI